MTTSAQFWDRVAHKYSRNPIKNPQAYQTTMERTRTYLSASDQVLEIGCGTGSTALLLAEHVAGMHATDVSGTMVEIAEAKRQAQGAENVIFRQAEATDGGVAEQRYDVVLAFNLLHLTRDPTAVARRAWDQLRPGGYFISKSGCLAHGWWNLLRPVLWMARITGFVPYVNFFSTSGLESAIRDAGFEIIETGDYPANPTSHFVVARKQ